MTGHRELIEATLEPGSFEPWPVAPTGRVADEGYAAELAAARERTGLTESVVTGSGTVGGHRVAVIVGEFRFLGGSIGVAAADAIVDAVTRATRERLPILASPVSGGTRMQEGTVAFLQMVKISAAIAAHKDAGLPYLVYLRNPTTGGVFASWGSMGHVTTAEPGALIGFLGPRVYEALHGQQFPEGVQTAENLFRLGLVDAVIGSEHLGSLVAEVLDVLAPADTVPPADEPAADPVDGQDDWLAVTRSRLSTRPGLRSLLRVAATSAVHLNGSASAGFAEGDRGLTLALARLGGRGVVVVGHDRRAQSGEVAIGPGALRAARRGIRLAEELGIPLVAVIDTPGAALSREAEEGGLAGEIAHCLAALLAARVPTVSVVLGQGAGGGALALIPADTLIVAENGWLAPLPPEGASAIVHRDAEHAPEMARQQRIAAHHLLQDGIADVVVPEHPSADLEPDAFSARVGRAVERALLDLDARGGAQRMSRRLEHYRRLGSTS